MATQAKAKCRSARDLNARQSMKNRKSSHWTAQAPGAAALPLIQTVNRTQVAGQNTVHQKTTKAKIKIAAQHEMQKRSLAAITWMTPSTTPASCSVTMTSSA
jgi:hypothetical protein